MILWSKRIQEVGNERKVARCEVSICRFACAIELMISGTGAMAIYPILLHRLRPESIILATGILPLSCSEYQLMYRERQ